MDPGKQKPTLEEVKKGLDARGLRPIDYKHLTYDQLLALAGVKV